MFESIAFYFFSALCIVSFLIVVISSQILYSMTALACGMIFVSGLFFTLGAEFLAVVQIIVYGGSVVALYAFAMMFFDISKNIESSKENRLACVLCICISLVLICMFSMPQLGDNLEIIADSQNLLNIPEMNNIQMIGYVLFTKYLIPFELAAFMLLVAMVAGIILSIKRRSDGKS